MGYVLIAVAAALFIGAVVFFVLGLRRSRTHHTATGRQDPLAADNAPQFGPRQLGPGAVVSYGGVDYVVRGSVTYRQGPYVWWEHLLEGGDKPLWFSVEDNEGRLELTLWVTREDLELQPGGLLEVDGATLHESEHGHASYTTEGETGGMPPGGEMDFIDYSDAGKTLLLSFERWSPDMPWEISTGKALSPAELIVYPAPPVPPAR
ncbi:DUF4178 domain-containing protein [Mycolicibacterium sphagni]|uniref:DUF4178 domain-containing protein n=1 Tax=Mycolicibacterium sphagni TaxID=1786 RepID=A0A255DI69_9MYCO|nr:DUF4178 domain-containing protein [Mycolicibacterium sphagni]MCV7174460.1 DUF4178 domain-containing protein [Mycolicibacterium sphagni]OYN75323.1 hypothetical protein CG716_25970 [Mycolicibacterium sphagni]